MRRPSCHHLDGRGEVVHHAAEVHAPPAVQPEVAGRLRLPARVAYEPELLLAVHLGVELDELLKRAGRVGPPRGEAAGPLATARVEIMQLRREAGSLRVGDGQNPDSRVGDG